MDSNDDGRILGSDTLHRSTAADSSDNHRTLAHAFSRFLILNSPELPPYWREGPKANWLHLPREVLATILLKLGAKEIIESAQKVCTLWRSVCMDPSLWTHIDIGKFDYYTDIHLANICRIAIDRSRGGCVDININHFCDDDLLNYITESGCKLRRLRLGCCWSVSDEGMAKAASMLPFLETFEYCTGYLSAYALEAIGKNCPRLTTLRYEQELCFKYRWEMENVAFAIAKYMPGLCHLSLVGIKLTDTVLGAILDGCPHLESLDLRQCHAVNLEGNDLAKKCKRIKDLKPPWVFTNSNNDYEDYYSDSDYFVGIDYEDYYSDSDYFVGIDYEDYDAEFSNYYGF